MATGPTPKQLANAAKLVESQEEYNKALLEAQTIQTELASAQRAAVGAAAEIQQVERARRIQLGLQAEEQQKITDQKRAQRQIEDQIAELKDQMQSSDYMVRDLAEGILQTKREELEASKGKLDVLQDELASTKDVLKVLNDKEKAAKKLQKDEEAALKKMQKLQEKYGDTVEDNLRKAEDGNKRLETAIGKVAKKIPGGLGGAIGKALDVKKGALEFATDIEKIGKEMGDKFGSLGPMLEGAGKSMGNFVKGLGMANIVMLAFAGIAAKMALDISNLSKKLGAATGFGDQFNTEIRRMGASGAAMGISFEDAAGALTALTTGLSSFNPAAEATNTHVGMTVAKLEKLGVSSADSVKSMDHMQRAMGMTAKQAADATAQLARMGKEIGITGTKMINDFNAASGRLAIYGKQNIHVFKELAAQAKATGIEMQSLLAISKNFDTFDAAAESAGKLNAVLGTQLSTIEMMNATDSERIMILKQEVQASVGNFDNLDKFTKQYIQQAMGVASVDEAQRLLNMSTSEYNKYAQGQKESADIQKEMAAAVAEVTPVMTQLKMAAISLFMAFEPLIAGFTAIIKAVGWLFSGLAELTGGMGEANKIGMVFKTILTGIAIALLVIFGPISATVGIVLALVAAFGMLYDIIHKPGSRSMAEGMMDKDIGASIGQMGADAVGAQKDISDLSAEMDGMHDAVHKGGGGAIDIQAMANLDTSAIAAGFDKIKSAVMELSSVKIDGFLAMRTDGSSSSFVMGSDGLIKSISEGKLTVDVKIPDMKMPDISVKVYIGDKELRDIIRTETKAVVGRAG